MRLETQGQGRVKEEAETGAMGLQAKDRQGWHAPPPEARRQVRPGFSLGVSRRNQPCPCLDFGQKNRRKQGLVGRDSSQYHLSRRGEICRRRCPVLAQPRLLILELGNTDVCASNFHPKERPAQEQSQVRNP